LGAAIAPLLLAAVDTELKSSITALQALATSRHLDSDDLRAFHDQATRILKSQPDWLTITLASPSAQQVVNVLRPFGAKLPTVTGRQSFGQVLQMGKPVVGSLALDELTQQYVFRVRVPVLRNGVIKYVLSAVVKPEAIGTLLASQRFPPDWIGVVLDGNKRFVTRTLDPERSLGQPASKSLQRHCFHARGWFRGNAIEGMTFILRITILPSAAGPLRSVFPLLSSKRRSADRFSVASWRSLLVSGIGLAWFQ
jgi:hypothetical protein